MGERGNKGVVKMAVMVPSYSISCPFCVNLVVPLIFIFYYLFFLFYLTDFVIIFSLFYFVFISAF